MSSAPHVQPERNALRQRVRRLAYWLDEAVTIPGTKVRVGLDALIGLVPVAGDLAGMALSGYLILQARRAGAPGRLQWQMLRNVLIETVVGLVPIIGDWFDVGWRANSRNCALLERWLDQAGAPSRAATQRRRLARIAGLLFFAAALATLVIVLTRPGAHP